MELLLLYSGSRQSINSAFYSSIFFLLLFCPVTLAFLHTPPLLFLVFSFCLFLVMDVPVEKLTVLFQRVGNLCEVDFSFPNAVMNAFCLMFRLLPESGRYLCIFSQFCGRSCSVSCLKHRLISAANIYDVGWRLRILRTSPFVFILLLVFWSLMVTETEYSLGLQGVRSSANAGLDSERNPSHSLRGQNGSH